MMKLRSSALIGAVLLTAAGCGQPSNVTLLKHGNHAMYLERWSDAADDFELATKQHPGDWEAQYNLGQCFLKLGNPEKASQALAIAVSLRPYNNAIADSYAEALLKNGNRNKLFSFLQGRAQKQQTVRAWTRFAEYAMDIDDPDSATNAINTAIAISDGTNAAPYITSATFAERLGDDSLAVKRWSEAWMIDPSNEMVSSSLRAHGVVPGPTMTDAVEDSQQ